MPSSPQVWASLFMLLSLFHFHVPCPLFIFMTVSPPVPSWKTSCPFSLACSTPAAATALWTLLACMPLSYALLFALLVRRAFLQMQGRPYASIKAANIRLWVVVRDACTMHGYIAFESRSGCGSWRCCC